MAVETNHVDFGLADNSVGKRVFADNSVGGQIHADFFVCAIAIADTIVGACDSADFLVGTRRDMTRSRARAGITTGEGA